MKTFAKRFGIRQWSFIGQGSEKKWFLPRTVHYFAESGHPIFRATTPLSRGQLKSKGKEMVFTKFSADQDTVDTIYRIIYSVNQSSIYGEVAALCDEYESHQDSTGQPVIFGGTVNCSWRNQSKSSCS